MLSLRLICIGVVVCASSALAQQAVVPPSELLARATAATSLPTVAMTIETIVEKSGEGVPTKRMFVAQYRRDGDRFDVITHSASDTDGVIAADPDDPANRTLLADSRFVVYRFLRGMAPSYLKTGPCDQACIGQSLTNDIVGGFLSGYLPGTEYSSVFNAAETDTVTIRSDALAGKTCLLVESQTKYGNIRIWLSEDDDLNPLKYSIERSATDHWNNVLVRDVVPDRPLARIVQEVENLDVREINDRKLVISGRYVHRLIYADGKVTEDITTCNRAKIDIEPDFAAMQAFELADVPDGTRVYTPEAGTSGVLYEWRGGTVIPAVSASVVNQIDATMQSLADGTAPVQPTLGTTDEGGFTVVIAVTVCAVTGIGLLVYAFSRGKRPGKSVN